MSKSTESKPVVRTPEFYLGLVVTYIIVLILNKMVPEALPFGLYHFFFVKFSLTKLMEIPWFLLLVGPGLVLLRALLTKRQRDQNIAILESTSESVKTSILAGIFEEVGFRWIGFYLAIFSFWSIGSLATEIWGSDLGLAISHNLWLSVPLIIIGLIVLNFAGLVGYGVIAREDIRGCGTNLIALVVLIVTVVVDIAVFLIISWTWTKWIFDTSFIPLVDFITQGRLHELLTNYGWAVTAAVVSVNWSFGKGHGYQGPFGVIDAWVFGMIMFWLTFNFGLPVAIIAHVGYDVLLNLIVATDAVAELGAQKR